MKMIIMKAIMFTKKKEMIIMTGVSKLYSFFLSPFLFFLGIGGRWGRGCSLALTQLQGWIHSFE